ncbi:hypothetical protein [Pseudomonas sp. F1002]|uniref:hypothetical protein n=2 Tax=Pseudomonas TaxID=286 RepID=UPI0015A1F6D9|nr:hypothetical protein [Pseudomonas sp. F1002]NWB63499.1 hypothetical protein [Pseudomonas sp. F1002]
MTVYRVSWSIDIATDGDHREAAKVAASLCFQARIAAGYHDTACIFEVTGPENIPVTVDLAESVSTLTATDSN